MAVHQSFIVLLTVVTTCATEDVKICAAVVGASITFPDPVTERGFLLFGPKLIASVSKGEFEIDEDIYTNRLHWSNTGLITLSGLQKSDSGVYTVDSKRGTVFSRYFKLSVYDPVSVPVVTAVNETRDSCTLQCSVNKTEQTTLSWFKGEDSVDRSSSEVLLLTVQLRNYNSEYLCVAENPADTKTVTVDITTVCKLNWEDWLFLVPLAVVGIGFVAVIYVVLVHVKVEKKERQ